MITNPSNNIDQRQIRDNNRIKNFSGQRITNDSLRQNQNQTGIYKKDIKRPQMNGNSAQNQGVKRNTLHTQAAYTPVYKNINAAAPAGANRQNVKNFGNVSGTYNYGKPNPNGAAFNRNFQNIHNTSAAPGRTRTNANGRVLGRATSIYSKNYVLNKERINGNYTSDKTTAASRRRKNYLTGDDITTRIRRVKEKIADGKLHASEIFKQLFLFKSLEQSKVITKEKKKKAIPVKTMFVIIMCAFFIMTWIFSGMKLHENALNISNTESEIVKLQKQIKTNEILLEDKNDLVYIENVAVNELGMIKKELLPTQYISVGRSDEVELTNAQNTDYVKITIDTLKDIFWRLK